MMAAREKVQPPPERLRFLLYKYSSTPRMLALPRSLEPGPSLKKASELRLLGYTERRRLMMLLMRPARPTLVVPFL